MQHVEVSFLILLAVAAGVALFASRTRLPYSIGLVVAGLVLGNVTIFSGPHLSKELLFLVVLPGLLFDAAFRLHFAEFWKVRVSILTLAIPGLVVSTLLTAVILWWAVNQLAPGSIAFIEAMVFGALISATDPISVLSIFRSLGVDPRLSVIVEGESLFNDGTAVVIFTIVLGIAMGGTLSLGGAALEFLRVAGLAALVGAVVGIGVSLLTRSIDDPMIEITLTVLSAYGGFIIAELLGLSGVIGCVVAGMVTGTWGARIGMRPTTRIAVDSFWTYAAFLLNSFVFLLVGFEINLATLAQFVPQILVAWIAINAARAAVVFSKYALMRASGNAGFPLSWAAILTWGGLRGGLSMVLALALPRDFVHRELILHMTFGVVLLSLLVQGLTVKPLLRVLGLSRDADDGRRLLNERLAGRRAADAGLRELLALHERDAVAAPVFTALERRYRDRLAGLGQAIDQLHEEYGNLAATEHNILLRHLAIVEIDAVKEAQRDGFLSAAGAETAVAQVNSRLVEIDAQATAVDHGAEKKDGGSR